MRVNTDRMIDARHIYTEIADLQDVYIKKMENLPPSLKFVFKVLELKGMLTQKEIIEETYLPSRTVRYALNRLKKEGFIEERLYFKDGRQCLYAVKSPAHDEQLSNFACGFI